MILRSIAGATFVALTFACATASAAQAQTATETPAQPPTRSLTIAQDVLGNVAIVAPQGEPKRFVIFISDRDGLTAARQAEAQKLVALGAAVALIDLPMLEATFAKRKDDDCSYVFGELEDLSRMAQRQLGVTDWQWPVLFGLGEGGTLAYLALAQAPTNTAGGAVSIGFSPTFPGAVPMCAGAPDATRGAGVITYTPMADLPAPWEAVLAAPPSTAQKAFVDAAPADAHVTVVAGDEAARFDAAAKALFAMTPPAGDALSDLPLTELPAAKPGPHLVILLSGDGGWRDIDKQIGEYLADHGVSVIGLDSLRYFWRRKDAKQIAADLQRIADYYLEKWKLSGLGLAGYSFGADVLPMTWPELEPATQARTHVIALLGIAPTFDLEVSVSGWLGLHSSTNIDMRPFLGKLPKERVLCFYGDEEKADNETACVLKDLAGATLIERPGGHHFDGNYQLLAEEILKRLPVAAPAKP